MRFNPKGKANPKPGAKRKFRRFGFGPVSTGVQSIIVLTVLCYAAMILWPDWIIQTLALSTEGLQHRYLWQTFTYMFVHDMESILHLMLNMLSLYILGTYVESAIGTRRFVCLYVLGGIFGALVTMSFAEGRFQLMGASAGVMAVGAAFVALAPRISLLPFSPVRIESWMIGLFVICWDMIGFLMEFGSSMTSNVAHEAHLGGAAVGLLYMMLLNRPLTEESRIRMREIKLKRRLRELSDKRQRAQIMEIRIEPIHPDITELKQTALKSTETASQDGSSKSEPSSSSQAQVLAVPSEEAVDSILDKLNESGFGSLTEPERALLFRRSEMLKE